MPGDITPAIPTPAPDLPVVPPQAKLRLLITQISYLYEIGCPASRILSHKSSESPEGAAPIKYAALNANSTPPKFLSASSSDMLATCNASIYKSVTVDVNKSRLLIREVRIIRQRIVE